MTKAWALKAMGLIGVGIVAFYGVSHLASRPAPAASPLSAGSAAGPAVAIALAGTTANSEAPAEIAAEDLPGAPATSPDDRAKPKAYPPKSTSIAAELTVLERARRAVGAGDGAAALAALDEHDRLFPHGILDQEAVLLRVRALVLLGDRRAAAAVARPFVAAHPTSHYADEMRRLLPGDNL